MKKIINRVGEKHLNNNGLWMTITACRKGRRCDIIFSDGVIVEDIRYDHIKDGNVNNPYVPSVYGIGYLGVGRHLASIGGKATKTYDNWRGMLQRCYSEEYLIKKPSYVGCNVDKEWHNFQSFAQWYEDNYKSHMDSSWDLDKDILQKGNKIYSSKTCTFVPKKINSLFVKNNILRGKYPIGVTMTKTKAGIERFHATIHENGRNRSVGTYDTPEEAFYAYKNIKEQHIKEVADKWRGQITEPCYKAMYAYEVEITD